MKRINTYYRKHGTCKGCEEVSDELAAKLDESMKTAYSWETAPFPSYTLSGNTQEMRRLKDRIKQLEDVQQGGYAGWTFNGGGVVANSEENRLQILFVEKPGEDLRKKLKSWGFRWSPSEKAWQRQLNWNAIYAASQIKEIHPESGADPRTLQPKRRPKEGAER